MSLTVAPLNKAVLLSFIAHAFFLSAVILTFPQKPIPEKPFFLFLGKIVPKHEFLLSDADQDQIPIQTLSNHLRISPDSRIEALILPKPEFQNVIAQPKKITLKPLYNASNEEDKDGSSSEIKLKDIPPTPSYERLEIFK